MDAPLLSSDRDDFEKVTAGSSVHPIPHTLYTFRTHKLIWWCRERESERERASERERERERER